MVIKAKIDRALASVHAAIADPTDEPLRNANHCSFDLLEELDAATLGPELRHDVARLTLALQTLKELRWAQPLCFPTSLPSVSHANLIPARALRAI